MKVGVADLVRSEGVARRTHYHVIIGAVIARVGLARSSHRLEIDHEFASQVPAERNAHIKVRIQQHLGDGLVIALDQVLVGSLMMLPNGVQPRLAIEPLQQWH